MDDILSYFESKDEMLALQKALELANKRIQILERRVESRSKRITEWKTKYKKLHIKFTGENPYPTRGERAYKHILTIMNNGYTGFAKDQIKIVMKEHFIGKRYADELWAKARKHFNSGLLDED